MRSGDHTVYLDLGNEQWEAVEITAVGWRAVASDVVPVMFLHKDNAAALPYLVTGGTNEMLRRLNFRVGYSDASLRYVEGQIVLLLETVRQSRRFSAAEGDDGGEGAEWGVIAPIHRVTQKGVLRSTLALLM